MTKVKYLPSGEVVWKGVKYPAFSAIDDNIIFDANRWFSFWRKKINEIKKLKLEPYQIRDISDAFTGESLMYCCTKQMYRKHQEYSELSSGLKLALHQAYSNYRDSKNALLGFFSGFFIDKFIKSIPTGIPIENNRKF